MNGARIVITAISAATGTCFAVLAGLSMSAIAVPVRRFHFGSIVIAALAICLGYFAFRAALAGKADEDVLVASLRRGMIGALVGLLLIIAFLLMFGATTQAFFAHALNKPASTVSTSRLLTAWILLGFGTGFVLRMPRAVPESVEEADEQR